MSAQKASNVVVSEAVPGSRGWRGLVANRKFQIAGAIVFVLLLGLAGYWFFFHSNPAPDTSSSNFAPTQLQPVKVDYVQMNNDDLTNKVGYLMGTRQYSEAEKLISIQKDLNTNPNKLMLLVGVQNAENKNAEATKTAEKLATLSNVQPGQYEVIGDQFQTVGDKAKAKVYYQKAVDGYNVQKMGSYQSNIARIQAKIKGLQ
jgi:hypothetical protein